MPRRPRLFTRLTSLAGARLNRPRAATPVEECQINRRLRQSTVPPEETSRPGRGSLIWRRLTDLPPAQEKRYAELECPSFATTPWVNGPPLAERRVAIISIVLSAGLDVEENGRSVRATGREIELGPERSSLRNQERKQRRRQCTGMFRIGLAGIR